MFRHAEPLQSTSTVGLSAAQDAATARRRLTTPGRKLIQDYVDSVHGHERKLTLEERRDLLRQIQALPGCAFYSLQNLNTWLQKHQYSNRPYHDKTEPPSRAGSSFPTLTPPMRAQLAALLALETNGDPGKKKVALWADMLAPAGAAREEALAYVELQLDYTRIKALQAQRLPTPTSPTPAPASPVGPVSPVARSPPPVVAYTGAHAYYAAPPLSKPTPPLRKPTPMLNKLTLPTRLGAKALPQLQPASPSVPPLPTPTSGYPSPALDTDADDMSILPEGSRAPTPAPAPAPAQTLKPPPAPARTLRASILQGVADALSAPPPALPAGTKPRTAEEFRALFAAFEAPLAQILCALES